MSRSLPPHPRPVAPALGSRYTITREIAAGGMATVYLGRLAGPGGFSRPVAIKRPHAHVAQHPEFRAMLLDEGRLAASVSHPNVVATLDVVSEGDDLFLVMEYVPGETLAQIHRCLRQRGETMPPAIACAVLRGVLLGLWAVHSARDDRGAPLDIVHRDISPQNILVGRDGLARILDFGVAKAAGRLQVTRDGQLKGKIAYMAPEQMQGSVTSRTDIYAASIVLWEALTARRLFTGNDDVETFSNALTARVEPPSVYGRASANAQLDAEDWAKLDAIVLRGLARSSAERFASAREMASALEDCVAPASVAEVAAWLERTIVVADTTAERAGEGHSGALTIDERGLGAPLETETKSGQGEFAVQIRDGGSAATGPLPISARDAAAPSDARLESRRGRFAALGVLAGALFVVVALVASHRPARPAARESAPAASEQSAAPPLTVEPATTPPAATAPVVASVPASAGVPLSPEGTAIVHAHPKPPGRNRIEHGPHVPVASPSVDVSHAIDQRH